MESFTVEVSGALQTERATGAEVPFEVEEGPAGPTPLYCYRALTAEFIGARLGLLSTLPTYGSAIRALEAIETVDSYLRHRGAQRVPDGQRERAELALELFEAAVFADRSQFEFECGRFEAAFAQLERVVYEGRCVTTTLAPLLGMSLHPDTAKVALGHGLALVRGELLDDAPFKAVWSEGDASVLVVFTVVEDRRAAAPVELARSSFRRVLTTLRLFEPGAYALGPIAWMRQDAGSWRPLALPFTGLPGPRTPLATGHEDELRGFFNLVGRRAAAGGELAWALARFEMGMQRPEPLEALTDYLLAARALLEPEGAMVGRLARRLAAICASPTDRDTVSARIAEAVALERLAIAGVAPAAPDSRAVVAELCDHLRAMLRDLLCGYLDGDLAAFADELLGEGEDPPALSSPSPSGTDLPTEELDLGLDQIGPGVDR